MCFIYLKSSLNSVSTSKARVLESETWGGDTFPCAPSVSGLQAAARGPRCEGSRQRGAAVGPQTRGVPAHGTARGDRGADTGARRASAVPLHARAAKTHPRPLFTQLSPFSLFTRKTRLAIITITKLELNFFSGKPFVSVLVLALIGWSRFFLQEGVEMISWKWANKVKMKYFKLQENAWIQIQAITDF